MVAIARDATDGAEHRSCQDEDRGMSDGGLGKIRWLKERRTSKGDNGSDIRKFFENFEEVR